MRLPERWAREGALERRMSKSQKNIWVIAIIVIIIFFILLLTWLLTTKLRRQGVKTRKPQEKLPSLFSWKNFRRRPRRNEYSTSLQDNSSARNGSLMQSRDREMSGSVAAANDPERVGLNQNQNSNTGVDRNTSVRSVMTLPAYAPAPRENERVLGREGERAGIDTVVEFPEEADEEEARREGEMESLYQIRLARRQEARDREERRQQRREARQRGDYEALAEIRRRAEQAAEESLSQMLIATHQSANRDRRVSSVQYGDLGVARHDGTRIRNSTDSDNRPLLDGAASFGSGGRARGLSNTTLATHHRGPSASSVRSVSSRASDEYDFPEATHTTSRASNSSPNSASDFEVVSLSHPNSRSLSRTTTPVPAPSIEIPTEDAPAYEHPPIYESPVSTRAPQLPPSGTAPQLPTLERLPSIQITPEPTPLDSRGHSPLSR